MKTDIEHAEEIIRLMEAAPWETQAPKVYEYLYDNENASPFMVALSRLKRWPNDLDSICTDVIDKFESQSSITVFNIERSSIGKSLHDEHGEPRRQVIFKPSKQSLIDNT